MADPQHLSILSDGVEAWEKWRQKFPSVRPDLRGANLSKFHLSFVHLIGAQLNEAYLDGANLSHARLEFADLSYAQLNGANLESVNLKKAKLSSTDLTNACIGWSDLQSADLTLAILRRTDCRGVNFNQSNLHEATLRETLFINTDLSNTKGLESCHHEGPSVLDFPTLQRSGMLPLTFLRGCGLSDNVIEYLPSLLSQPIQYQSCFISYSSKDSAFAERLYADLQNKGVRCWFAPEDMKIGDKIRTRIDEVIHVHEKLLIVLSENSIKSSWVEKEVETGFEKEKETNKTVLFPIRLDDAVMGSKAGWAGDIKRTRHIGDFCNWKQHDDYQKNLQRLFRDLKVENL